MASPKNVSSKFYMHSSPRMLVVDTTDICNLQCKMCHQNSPDFTIAQQPHIDLKMIKDISSIAAEAKTIYLLGAGEPLMHPDIYEIIEIFKDNCPQAIVATTSNGVLLNEKNLNNLIESRIDQISFSMDGEIERGHQKSDRTRKNLLRLSEKKKELGINYPNIYIGFVLGKDNEGELIPIIEFARSINAVGITVEPLRILTHQVEWDAYIEENDPFKHLKTISPIIEQARLLCANYGMIFNAPYIN